MNQFEKKMNQFIIMDLWSNSLSGTVLSMHYPGLMTLFSSYFDRGENVRPMAMATVGADVYTVWSLCR